MGLPTLWWKKSARQMMKEEEWSLIEELQYTQVTDERYQVILSRYKELHELQLEDKKLRSYVTGKLIDLGSTLGLAAMVMTHEMWTPIASNWAHSITGKITHNDVHLLS